jgi:GMP synthase-like glutamine amidotransferase
MLHIGLLKADYVNPELIPLFGDLPDMFSRFFSRVGPLQLDVFDVTLEHFPNDDYRCDAFVITGSRNCALDEIPWVEHLKAFVAARAGDFSKLIGFCFGHQVLASALGGRVERAPKGWNVGIRPLRIVERADWMLPQLRALNLLFNHRDQVVSAPAGARVLAGDEICLIQMFSMNDQVLGLQAHPEYAIPYQQALMDVASAMTPAVKADATRRNQAIRPDDDIALEWLVRFIRM